MGEPSKETNTLDVEYANIMPYTYLEHSISRMVHEQLKVVVTHIAWPNSVKNQLPASKFNAGQHLPENFTSIDGLVWRRTVNGSLKGSRVDLMPTTHRFGVLVRMPSPHVRTLRVTPMARISCTSSHRAASAFQALPLMPRIRRIIGHRTCFGIVSEGVVYGVVDEGSTGRSDVQGNTERNKLRPA